MTDKEAVNEALNEALNGSEELPVDSVEDFGAEMIEKSLNHGFAVAEEMGFVQSQEASEQFEKKMDAFIEDWVKKLTLDQALEVTMHCIEVKSGSKDMPKGSHGVAKPAYIEMCDNVMGFIHRHANKIAKN